MARKKYNHGGCQPGKAEQRCELCQRIKPVTEHHLIPRSVHDQRRFIERFGVNEMRTRKLRACKLCHDGIHDIVKSEKELAENYNTRELLLAHAGIARHVAWVRKQK